MHCYGYGYGYGYGALTTVSDCGFGQWLHSAKVPTRNGAVRLRLRVRGSVKEVSQSVLSFYEVLGVPESGSTAEVKHAYRQLARKWHPDVSPPGRVDEYTKRFIQVQEAYHILSDPSTRATYDARSNHRLHYNQVVVEQKNEWKNRWKCQLSMLKRRSKCRDIGGENMAWAYRMRRKRDELVNAN